MRFLTVIVLAILLAALAVVVLLRVRPDAVPAQYLERITHLPQQVRGMTQRLSARLPFAPSTQPHTSTAPRSPSLSARQQSASAAQTARPAPPHHRCHALRRIRGPCI